MTVEQQDLKKDYITKRDEFKKRKIVLIAIHKGEISELERKINEARPRTESGEKICTACNCVSMKYMGRSPRGGLAGGDDIYQCEICDGYN